MSNDRQSPPSAADLELLRLAGPRQPAPPDLQARVYDAVRDHWQGGVRARRRRRWTIAVASGLAAAATLTVAILVHWTSPGPPGAQVATAEVVRGEVVWTMGGDTLALGQGAGVPTGGTVDTGAVGRAALRLSGGASVRLDTATRVTLEGTGRLLLSRGAIYVDSGPEPGVAGVVVATPLAELRDIGTQFEVRLLDDGLTVRVREGQVSLRRPRAADVVGAGEEAVLAGDGSVTLSPVAVTGPEWAWLLEVAPPFRLEGSSAAAFLRWAGRETGLELQWARPGLADAAEGMRLHGDISRVRPDRAFDVVLPTCGLAHRVEKGALIIDRAAAH